MGGGSEEMRAHGIDPSATIIVAQTLKSEVPLNGAYGANDAKEINSREQSGQDFALDEFLGLQSPQRHNPILPWMLASKSPLGLV